MPGSEGPAVSGLPKRKKKKKSKKTNGDNTKKSTSPRQGMARQDGEVFAPLGCTKGQGRGRAP